MGQNFGTILIKRKEEKWENEVSQVLSRLNIQFEKDKEGLTYTEFFEEIWSRSAEGLIGLFFNQRIIIIEDEYDLLRDNFLEEISETLNTEVIRVTNSDTVGLSMIQIYDNGNLIRMKSYGLEEDIDMLSGNELKSVKGIGEPTIYEEKGSDAINVLDSFTNGRIQFSKVNDVTLFKEIGK